MTAYNTPEVQTEHQFLPVHLKVLQARSIDPKVAWDAGLRSLDFTSELKRKTWKDRNPGHPTYHGTALKIPSWSRDKYGQQREHKRLRWDERVEWGGIPGADETTTEIPRYTTAQGDHPPPFITPMVERLIGDTTTPRFITEAALKALCLQSHGHAAIGLAGVEVGAKDPELWRSTRTLAMHPEMKRLGWLNVPAYVSFDAGAANNLNVALAQARTCRVLYDERATVWIVRLPPRDEVRIEDIDLDAQSFVDQGPDDFVAQQGIDAYRCLVRQAVPGNPLAWVQSIVAANSDEPKDLIGQLLAALLNDIQFKSLLEVFPKATLEQVAAVYKKYAAIGAKSIKEAIAEQRARRAAARERDGENDADAETSVQLKVGDQAELASYLVSKYMVGEIVPVYDEGSVHAYDPERGIWAAVSDDRLSQDLQALSGAAVGGKRRLLVTSNMIHGTLQCLVAKIRKAGFFADAPRDGIAMRNGYARVTAAGVQTEKHSPEHRQRHHHGFDYEPGQKPKRFVEALDYAFRGDEDAKQKIDLIQEFTGICRIGQATRYEQAIFLHGPRADDGKSTVLAILSGTFDPSSVACISPWEVGDRFRLQELVSKLINITDDDRSDMIAYAGLFKSLVTAKNANFTYERKGRDSEKFRPIAGHICAVNTLPRADDSTNGWFRRQLVIQFNNQVEPARKIRSYETSILAEEQQAIVGWTLDGAARCLRQNGYTVPASSVVAVDEWRQQSCSAFLFAAECCKQDDSESVQTTLEDLYPAYLEFCEAQGIDKVLKKQTLGTRLVSHRHKCAAGNHYHLVPLTAAERDQPIREAKRVAFERQQALWDKEAEQTATELAHLMDDDCTFDTGTPTHPMDATTMKMPSRTTAHHPALQPAAAAIEPASDLELWTSAFSLPPPAAPGSVEHWRNCTVHIRSDDHGDETYIEAHGNGCHALATIAGRRPLETLRGATAVVVMGEDGFYWVRSYTPWGKTEPIEVTPLAS